MIKTGIIFFMGLKGNFRWDNENEGNYWGATGDCYSREMSFKPFFIGLFHLYLLCLLYSLQTQYLILKLNFSVSIVSCFFGLVYVFSLLVLFWQLWCLHKLTGHRLDTSWFSWSVNSFVKVAYRTTDAIVISLLLVWFTSMLFQEIKLQLLHYVYF